MFGQLFAGTGLGLLVGILVGLSSSPVVSVVVGALAAGMVTLLGYTRSSKDGEHAYSQGSVLRLGSFGVACAIAILGGLYIRTHNWLSPTISEQVADVQKAGYTPEEAHRWVAYKNVGTVLTSASGTTPAPSSAANSVASSVLFAGDNSGECQNFDPSRFKDTQEQLYALRQLGGKHAEYAEKIATLDAAKQRAVLDSLKLLFCAQ